MDSRERRKKQKAGLRVGKKQRERETTHEGRKTDTRKRFSEDKERFR